MSAIGKMIKNARLERNMSQKELAFKLGYDDGQIISNWERGAQRPTPKKLPTLCRILDLDKDHLKTIYIMDMSRKLRAI